MSFAVMPCLAGLYRGQYAAAGPEAVASWIGATDIRTVDPCTGLTSSFSFAGSWTDNFNWSGGAFPNDLADEAVFGQPVASLGDITVDTLQTVSLGTLTITNNRGLGLQSSNALGGIDSAAGLVINSLGGLPELDPRFVDRVGSITFGSRIQVPMSGGTLTVTGPAPLWLAAANTVSHLRVVNGIVTLADAEGSAPGDFPTPVIGESQLGNGAVTLDGGTLRVFSDRTPSSVLTPLTRDIILGAGGGTLVTAHELGEITGVISGTGALNTVMRSNNTPNLVLNNNMTYTGATNVRAGTLQIGGNAGRISATSALNNTGTLLIANGTAVELDRVNDTAPYVPSSGVLVVSSEGEYTETMGDLLPQGGVNSIVLKAPDVLGTTRLQFGDLIRNHSRGAVFFAGRNLGGFDVGTLQTNVYLANGSSSLVGDGGTARSMGIIPFAWGAAGNTGVIGDGGGTGSFVTYTVEGVRPLDLATEYVQSVGASTNPNDNVRVTSSELSFGKAIGALLLGSPQDLATGTPSTLTINGLLTLNKGVLLNTTQGNTINGVGGITSGGPSFELLILASSASSGTAGLNINAPIIDNASSPVSVTRLGPGSVFFNAVSAYTGETTIGGGRTFFNQNVAAGVPGPFGNATSPIVMYSTGASLAPVQTRLLTQTAGLTFGRAISFRGASAGGGSTGALIGTFNDNVNTVWTGNWDVGPDVQLFISGNNTLANSITGTGLIRDNFVPLFPDMDITFAGNNTGFTGSWWIVLAPPVTNGTTGERFVFNAGAVNPLGTGNIYIDSTPIFVANAPVSLGGQWTVLQQGLGRFVGPAKTTITGQVNLGSIRGDIRIGSGTTATAAGEVEISGNLLGGTFALKGVEVGTTGVVSTGTLTLSGNNSGLTGSIYLGDSAVPAGTCTSFRAEIPGGVLRLTNPQAIGAQDVVVKAEDSTVQLTGGIALGSASNFYIAGDGVGTGNLALGAINSAAGDNTIAGNITLLDHLANDLTLEKLQAIRVENGSTLTHTGLIFDATTGSTAVSGASTLMKTGGGTLTLRRLAGTSSTAGNPDTRQSLSQVLINAGTVRVSPTPTSNDPDGLSAVNTLGIQTGARLDLGNNSLIVDYTGGTVRALIEFWTAGGYAGGAWNGPGIDSSSADATRFALGVAEATETPFSASYLGHPIDGTTVIARFTRYGDANLDGVTNIDDFSRLASSFNLPGRWATGDFNYDGIVNIADFSLLAGNFNLSATAVPRGAAVPEPTATLILAASALTGRRRKRRLRTCYAAADVAPRCIL